MKYRKLGKTDLIEAVQQIWEGKTKHKSTRKFNFLSGCWLEKQSHSTPATFISFMFAGNWYLRADPQSKTQHCRRCRLYSFLLENPLKSLWHCWVSIKIHPDTWRQHPKLPSQMLHNADFNKFCLCSSLHADPWIILRSKLDEKKHTHTKKTHNVIFNQCKRVVLT